MEKMFYCQSYCVSLIKYLKMVLSQKDGVKDTLYHYIKKGVGLKPKTIDV